MGRNPAAVYFLVPASAARGRGYRLIPRGERRRSKIANPTEIRTNPQRPDSLPRSVQRPADCLVHRKRAEPFLPQMSALSVSKIGMPRIATVRLAQRGSETILTARNHDEMDVIGHQAIGPDLGLRALREFGDQFDVVKMIVNTKGCLLSTIAALRNVMGKDGTTTLGILAIAYFPIRAWEDQMYRLFPKRYTGPGRCSDTVQQYRCCWPRE